MLQQRDEAINLLFGAGYRLRLSAEVTATAIMIFHRYLPIMDISTVSDDDKNLVITTCLFLAAKLEESPRRLRDVINVTHRLTSKNRRSRKPATCNGDAAGAVETTGLPDASQKMRSHDTKQFEDDDDEPEPLHLDHEYWALKEKVVGMEQRLLRTIGFDLELCHPYRLILHFAKALNCPQSVVQRAWALTNDVLWDPECLQLRPSELACGVIYIAARFDGDVQCLPAQRAQEEPSWWCHLGVQNEALEKACLLIINSAAHAAASIRVAGRKRHAAESGSPWRREEVPPYTATAATTTAITDLKLKASEGLESSFVTSNKQL